MAIALTASLQDALPARASENLVYRDTQVPVIFPRATWENDSTLKNLLTWLPSKNENRNPPDYALVERVIVHDQGCGDPATCTANAEQYPLQTIQNIYRFHAVTRTWGDIGYNYIIDRQGGIYEGRFGGNGVRGAHLYYDRLCQNFNIGSAGVLLLGDWRAGPIPDLQQKGLERLTAWLGATNGFDPADTSRTSKIWESPTAGSGCDVSRGGFTATFSGSALLSHGDIETGNSDSYDFSPLRQTARNLAQRFASYVWKTSDDPTLFSIQGGGVYLAETPADAANIVSLAVSQLDMFPFRQVRALADGTLIRGINALDVYVMEAGQRHSIAAPILFALLGYDRARIQAISERELVMYPLGNPKAFPDDTLVRERGKEDVFVSKGGFLRHINSAALFTKLGYSWQKILSLAPEDFSEMPVAGPMRFPDGTLLKTREPRVYLVQEGERRPVGQAALFSARGFLWDDIITLEDYELKRYPLGAFLPWPEGFLIRAQGYAEVFWVQHGFRRWVATAQQFRDLKYRWEDVHVVSAEELNVHPEGPVVDDATDLSWQPPAPEQKTDAGEKEGTVNSGETPQETPVPPPSEPRSAGPLIRIGLSQIGAAYPNHQGSSVEMSYSTAATLMKNGTAVKELAAEERYSVIPQNGEVWRLDGQEDEGIATIHTYTDHGWAAPGAAPPNDNRFRGALEITQAQDGTFWLINELPIEDYLKGIAEMANGEQEEYAQAFIIAARSYAAHYLAQGGKRPAEPFHMRRTTADQWYKGYGFELRATDAKVAAEATRGIVAEYQGAPIIAAYSSGAPGPTLSACELWGGKFCDPAFDYLDGGVGDPEGTAYKYAACGGAVHCVGMDTAGARRMITLGADAQAVLETYYPGATLTQKW